MLSIFEVSKLERSTEARDEQPAKRLSILVRLLVSKPLRLMEVSEEQPWNIAKIEMVFEVSDDTNHSILKWSYDHATKKNSFVFTVNGNAHVIDDIHPKMETDWFSFRFTLLPKGIVLLIEDELVCMVRTQEMKTSYFTVQLTTTPMASLKHIYIYDRKQ